MKYPAIQTKWQNSFAQGSPLIQKIFLVLQYSIAHHDLLPLTNIRILFFFQIYVFWQLMRWGCKWNSPPLFQFQLNLSHFHVKIHTVVFTIMDAKQCTQKCNWLFWSERYFECLIRSFITFTQPQKLSGVNTSIKFSFMGSVRYNCWL